jgi:hypothetical protein
MKSLSFKQVLKKYNVGEQGKYNKSIFTCNCCNNDMDGKLFINTFGFFSNNCGNMIVVECDKCFEKFYFHGDNMWIGFLDCINNGTSKFFKKPKNKIKINFS